MSINATFLAQLVVFFLLAWVTMKFIWPPLSAALDERALKIKAGLEAADTARAELADANRRVQTQLEASRNEAAARMADVERRAHSMMEEAKARATEEGNRIVAAARAEAQQQTAQAREVLRSQVAALAVKGAEQILAREVNAQVHAELLARLRSEL